MAGLKAQDHDMIDGTATRDPANRDPQLTTQLDQYRAELTGYCYRMLGSGFEAEDAVQETMVRAWKAYDSFEGRSALRSWLYRIATNVCLDMLRSAQRRARPVDMGNPSPGDAALGAPLAEQVWIQPVPDSRVLPPTSDPAELAVGRDTIRLAFVAALQFLPPRQRAVLILREVLHWHASEVAELLDTSVASVNSALQRARATLESRNLSDDGERQQISEADGALLDRYVDAFERYDMTALIALLHEDATMSMPPFSLWLRGHDDIRTFFLGTGIGCRGSRMVPVVANGAPGFGQYKVGHEPGTHLPWSLQVLEISDGRISELTCFLDQRLFAHFDLKPMLTSAE